MTQTKLSLALLVPFVLFGCGQVKGAVGDVANTAARQAGAAATDEVTRRVCAQLPNGQLSAQNKQVLGALLPAAKTAGLPSDLTTALEQVAQSGDQPPAQAVTTLRQMCASPPPSP